MKSVLAATVAIVISGCASNADEQLTTSGVQCWRETPTGSNLPVTRCMSDEESKRQREATDDFSDAVRRSTPAKGRSGGQ